MMYTVPVSPSGFHGESHIPIQISCRPRRGCRPAMHCGYQSYGPPAWLFTNGGRPQQQRSPFPVAPFVEDVVGIWKAMAGIPDREPEKPQAKPSKTPDWKTEVDGCEGFSPDEVKLEISGDKVYVTCIHENSDGKGNSQVRQMKRTINLPRNVNGDKITATFDNRGILSLSAPRTVEQSSKPEGIIQQTPPDTTEPTAENCNGDVCNAEASDTCKDCTEVKHGEITKRNQLEIQKSDVLNAVENKDVSEEDVTIPVQPENKPFEIKVDMESFNPDSIEVKLNENLVTITGNREQRDEAAGTLLSSQTVFRRLTLPENVNTDLLKSTLDKRGQLTISAPYKTEK